AAAAHAQGRLPLAYQALARRGAPGRAREGGGRGRGPRGAAESARRRAGHRARQGGAFGRDKEGGDAQGRGRDPRCTRGDRGRRRQGRGVTMATTVSNPATAFSEAARFGEIRSRLMFLIGALIVYRIG